MQRTNRYTQFMGLDNSNDPVKFANGEKGIKLSVASNVNISRTMSVERRDGYSLWKSGQYKSLWGNGKVCYALEYTALDGNLVEINADKTRTVLFRGAGNFPVNFADARNGFVYFTNGIFTGKIKNGSVTMIKGTDTEPTTSDQFKGALPAGDFLSFLSPRVLVARNNVLYISDAVNRDIYHTHMGFLQFDSDIRMIAPVGNSMFVSDSYNTWFLRKMQSQLDLPTPMFKMEKIASYPSIQGNPVKAVDGIKTGLAIYNDAAMWTSTKGVCIGNSEGVFENITEDRYDMPASTQMAYCTHRKVNDLNLFITAIKGM